MPVLSIIVPVYNVATYLREGLDSILRQEVQDIEVICVDDCSSDSSPDILKEYQAKDNRIQFIRQSENILLFSIQMIKWKIIYMPN